MRHGPSLIPLKLPPSAAHSADHRLPRTPASRGAGSLGGAFGSRFWGRSCALLALLAMAACGRPATEQECDEIVERLARLKLQQQGNLRQETVDEKVAEAKQQARQNKNIDLCLGNRVTDKAMNCVRQAQSADAIPQCFR